MCIHIVFTCTLKDERHVFMVSLCYTFKPSKAQYSSKIIYILQVLKFTQEINVLIYDK